MKLYMAQFFTIIFTLLIGFQGFQQSAFAAPHSWLTDIRVGANEAKYTAVIISIDGSGDSPFSQVIAREAYHWIFEEYKRRYPQIDPAVFDRMKSLDTPLDGRSIFGIIFTKDNPKDIKATLRFTFPSLEHPLLSMEEYFRSQGINWEFPRPKVSVEPYQWMLMDQEREILGLTGNVIELKNFVMQEGLEDRLVPILFHLVEMEAWSQFENTSSDYYHHMLVENPNFVRTNGKPIQVYELDRNRLRSGLDLSQVNRMHTLPAEYVIECDRLMVPYYQRLGFKLMSDHPIVGNTFVLSMNRKAFIEIGRKFRNQPGGELVSFANIRSVNDEQGKSILLSKLLSGSECLGLLSHANQNAPSVM